MSEGIPDVNQLTEERRQAIKKSIHPIGLEEMKALGEKLFPFLDHPFRLQFFHFLEENPRGKYFHATTDDNISLFYCQDRDKGLWVLTGGGVGPLQEMGLKAMKEALAKG